MSTTETLTVWRARSGSGRLAIEYDDMLYLGNGNRLDLAIAEDHWDPTDLPTGVVPEAAQSDVAAALQRSLYNADEERAKDSQVDRERDQRIFDILADLVRAIAALEAGDGKLARRIAAGEA